MKLKGTASKRLFSQAGKVFPGGVNSPVRFYPPYPLFMKEGSGSRISDTDGNQYTDYVLGYGPLILGHAHPLVREAVSRAVARGMIFGAPTEAEVKLGEMIAESSPAVEMIRLVPSGSEATMHALRLSQFHTHRRRILKVKGGYHGTNTFAQKSSSVKEIEFNSVEEAEVELRRREYAAFIVEPVMGNCGIVCPDSGYLPRIRELTRETGTIMICDEVITGYRTRFGTYSEAAGVLPDLITLGKIIGGGMPLAAFGGRAKLMKHVRPHGDFNQAGTYAAHPVCIAAGLQTLELLKKSDYSTLAQVTEIAASRLRRTGLTVNSAAGMLSLFFTEGEIRNGTEAGSVDGRQFFQLFRSCLTQGIYLPPSQQEAVFLSFAHKRREVGMQFDIIADSALEIRNRRSQAEGHTARKRRAHLD